MKKLILSLLCVIACFSSIAQGIDYPRYEIDSLGQKVVVITVDQAIALDNNSELLSLFEKLNAQIGEYDSVCIKTIAEKDEVIAIQKVQIAKLRESVLTKDGQIIALQAIAAEHKARILMLEEKLKITQKMIDEKNKQIRKLKIKNFFVGIGGSLATIGLILALVLVN